MRLPGGSQTYNRLWNPPKKRLNSVQFNGTTTTFRRDGVSGGKGLHLDENQMLRFAQHDKQHFLNSLFIESVIHLGDGAAALIPG